MHGPMNVKFGLLSWYIVAEVDTEILQKQTASNLKFFCAFSDTHLNFWNGGIIFLQNN
jgi:hypothetical protein